MPRIPPTRDDDEPLTAGEVRRRIAESGAEWTVDERLADDEPVPRFHTGGEEEPPQDEVEIDFAGLFATLPPTNPFLIQEAVEAGDLDKSALELIEGVPWRPDTDPPPRDEG